MFTYYAELYLGTAWTDITGDVRGEGSIGQGFDISRGRANEAGRAAPGRCMFTIDNRTGNYSPRNPSGAYFGQLGRNTPFRLRIPSVNDTFARVTADAWGVATSGQTWTCTGGAAANYSTDATYGKFSLTTVNVRRRATVDQPADLTQYATVRTSAQAVTDSIVAGFIVRYLDSSNYYECRLYFNPTATGFDIDAAIVKTVAGVVSDVATNTATGLTYVANRNYGIRFEATGSLFKLKIWDATGAEPAAWLIETTDTDLSAPGTAGPHGYLTAANTNALPVTLSWDDYAATEVRFHGEVSNWPQKWDTSGTDVYATVEASGILRRLGQSATVAYSALRRLFTATPHSAYWPVEDQSGAGTIASADSSGLAATYGSGITLAASPALSGTLPVALLASGAGIYGSVSGVPVTTASWTVGFLLYIPAVPAGNSELIRWATPAGMPAYWAIVMKTDSTINLWGLDPDGTLMAAFDLGFTYTDTTGTISQFGKWCYVVCGATQSGGNIAYFMNLSYAAGGVAGLNTTDAGTVESITSAWTGATGIGGSYFGHLILTRDTGPSISSDMSAYLGTAGERAGRRILRLAAEAGIPCQVVGDPDDTVLMGPQRVGTVIELLGECADADRGILSEQRAALGLLYVTSRSLCNQTATALSYSANELSPPFEPVDDDQGLVNDATASRTGGTSARYTQTTGTLGTATVGTYDESRTVAVATDSQLADQASWSVHIGTHDATRFPTISVNLARSPFTASASKTRTMRGLREGSWLAVTSPPAWLPPDSIEVVVQGVHERLTQFEQIVSWNCTPAGPYRAFTFSDTDATYGRLECSGITLAEDLTTTETDADVTIAAGSPPFRVTASGDVPFDIIIAGERMTVTAVASATSPQTLTVTRSVNGVVKAQVTGAEVLLWNPAYLGLA